MAYVYNVEPNTNGKVVLHTSHGDIDIELWSEQAPMTCRNFVQLCLEGYYDNTIFHRIIKNMMIQGGDPTGTGQGICYWRLLKIGGESIYDQAFKDEFNPRLKFSHRGIVAMANENRPNTNHSQFFITLGATDWLEGKNTIFGKVTGNTIFNVLKMGELATDNNDRPHYPPTINSVSVITNPFPDIVPRHASDCVCYLESTPSLPLLLPLLLLLRLRSVPSKKSTIKSCFPSPRVTTRTTTLRASLPAW